jgi:hypothetical protein
MLKCDITLDELDECHNSTKLLMHIIMWYDILSMSQSYISINASRWMHQYEINIKKHNKFTQSNPKWKS